MDFFFFLRFGWNVDEFPNKSRSVWSRWKYMIHSEWMQNKQQNNKLIVIESTTNGVSSLWARRNPLEHHQTSQLPFSSPLALQSYNFQPCNGEIIELNNLNGCCVALHEAEEDYIFSVSSYSCCEEFVRKRKIEERKSHQKINAQQQTVDQWMNISRDRSPSISLFNWLINDIFYLHELS